MVVSIGVAARIFSPFRSSRTFTGFLARWKCPGGCTQNQSTFTSLNSFLKYLSKIDMTARLPPRDDLNSSGSSVAAMSGNRPGVYPGVVKRDVGDPVLDHVVVVGGLAERAIRERW